MISSNTRRAGTQCLQLHDILLLPLRQEGIHNDGHPCCIWCICGYSCIGSHFLAYAQVKVEVVDESIILLVNNSLALAPTVSILTYSCLLQSIQLQWGSSLVHVLTHHTYCGNHGHCDCHVALAFGCIQWPTTIIITLGFMLGVCSCVTRMTQISNSTRLVKEVFCMFRHQLCMERDVTAAFLPHQGKLLVQGVLLWWLWSQTWLSSCSALGCQDWWQLMLTWLVILEYTWPVHQRLSSKTIPCRGISTATLFIVFLDSPWLFE